MQLKLLNLVHDELLFTIMFEFPFWSIHSHPLTITDNAYLMLFILISFIKAGPFEMVTITMVVYFFYNHGFTDISSFQWTLQTMLKMGVCPTWSRWYCRWRRHKSSYRARTSVRTRRSYTRNTSSYRKEVDTWPPWTVGTSCLKCLTSRWLQFFFL